MANSNSVLHGVEITDVHYFAFGGYGDIYRGRWTLPTGGTLPVAVKLIRQSTWNDETAAAFRQEVIQFVTDLSSSLFNTCQRFLKEARLWTQLRHPNIIPFYGLIFERDSPCLVMPYYKKGDLRKFLRENPDANKLNLMREVSAGLEYLHNFKPNPVIHGDLKASNILVTDQNRACLADFGEAKMVNTIGYEEIGPGGSLRWMSPEIIRGTKTSPTVASDVWAFAMTILEVYTGMFPFHNLPADGAVIVSLNKGELPPRPLGISDTLWALLKCCWVDDPVIRPTISIVSATINTMVSRSTVIV